MVKVLIKKFTPKTVTCQNCESLLQYVNPDIRRIPFEKPVAGYRDVIICPNCQEEVVVYHSREV